MLYRWGEGDDDDDEGPVGKAGRRECGLRWKGLPAETKANGRIPRLIVTVMMRRNDGSAMALLDALRGTNKEVGGAVDFFIVAVVTVASTSEDDNQILCGSTVTQSVISDAHISQRHKDVTRQRKEFCSLYVSV